MFNQIVIGLLASYIFVCTIPYTPAARYIILVALLATSAIGLFRKSFAFPPRSSMILGLGLFVGIALISATLSPYQLESFHSFRKEYLPPLLILLIASCLKQNPDAQIRAAYLFIWSLLAGFVVKTALALWDGAINHPFIFSPYSNADFVAKNGLPRYVSYYAVDAVLYLALAYSTLLFLAKGWAVKISLALVSMTSLFILMASGIRTAFVATMLGLAIITLAKLQTRKKILIFALLSLTVGATSLYLGRNNTEVKRYIGLAKAERYSKQEGMSGRYQIWEGVSELVTERPWLGFGPGWQKLPAVAQESGLLSKWQSESTADAQLKYSYFSQGRGIVNPHNLPLQILFETGFTGLASYLVMLSALFWNALKTGITSNQELDKWLKVTFIGYGCALLVMDVTNAFLLDNTMVALMLIATLIRQAGANQHT